LKGRRKSDNGRKTDGPHPAIDSPDRRRLPLLLRRAWYGLNQAFRRRMAHLGVTPDQFTVMRTLLEHEGITQRKLTELMSSDPNTVASLLERMEKANLLERQTHEKDRRANCLRLKPLAKEKYETARGIAVALQSEILGVLPEERREEFLEHLDAVAEACRIAAETSPRQNKRRTVEWRAAS
jgi:DNA-binding MarR family transcriptional regulator